jgi:enoyl-CoA hydratase/carnithine racemase
MLSHQGVDMDYTRFKNIIVEKHDGICTVTLNRPEVLNAVNAELQHSLEYVWVDLAVDPDVNVIILTGAGRAFSAGGDLQAIAKRFGTDEGRKTAFALTARGPRILANMLEVPQPIIAAINGDAMGLGATLALMCDISVMSHSARIGDTHVRVGLVAGDGGAVIWPLLIGANRAKEFLMRGRVVNGSEAAQLGIVNHGVPAEQVIPEAQTIARELSALPRLAVQWSKVAANKIIKSQLNLAMDASIAYEALTMFSHDHLEAAQSFLDKRKPKFGGS